MKTLMTMALIVLAQSPAFASIICTVSSPSNPTASQVNYDQVETQQIYADNVSSPQVIWTKDGYDYMLEVTSSSLALAYFSPANPHPLVMSSADVNVRYLSLLTQSNEMIVCAKVANQK